MEFDLADRLLIFGAVANLAYGFLTGFLLGKVRETRAAPRYLTLAHTGPLMQAAMLFGLVFALKISALPSWAECTAAALFVLGSALIAARDTANWAQGVEDEFIEKPNLGTRLGLFGALASTVGLGIIIVGIVMAFL